MTGIPTADHSLNATIESLLKTLASTECSSGVMALGEFILHADFGDREAEIAHAYSRAAARFSIVPDRVVDAINRRMGVGEPASH